MTRPSRDDRNTVPDGVVPWRANRLAGKLGQDLADGLLAHRRDFLGGLQHIVVYVERRNIVYLDMSVEDAAKLLLSAGLVMPDYFRKTGELAAAAERSEPCP